MADRTYLRLVGARLRGQLAYRRSFLIQCLGQAVGQFAELVLILVMFTRVDALGGFAVTEVLLVYSFAGLSFALADLFVGQIDELPNHVRTGSFDTLLLRPLGTLGQIVVSEFQIRRVGRILSALGMLVFALWHNDIAWSPATVALITVTPAAGAVIFASVWVAAGSVCFWLVEGRELSATVTYGNNAFTSYPVSAYSGWIRWFLGYVAGGAFVAYYPALALLDRADPLGGPAFLGWISPLVALVAASLAGLVWRFAVRHYRGTGS
ncbi:ABC-2 family transporter protein [Saccharothrix violaceirubra]|uniref:ABC-2 type transport system permease protein n=1 Tax=Saccharothrix violaceirubra TaxID=413306 RepID=A0A7W7SY30_9PSEU|nr:ABC-2 family transporter protein [Saccharothrix violaceirubra]MBB4963014.1 ABC-2 type transport system permease protein [Saccharothrix violaceirubra]